MTHTGLPAATCGHVRLPALDGELGLSLDHGAAQGKESVCITLHGRMHAGPAPGRRDLVLGGIYGHERGTQRRHTAATDLLSPRDGRRQMPCNYRFISPIFQDFETRH